MDFEMINKIIKFVCWTFATFIMITWMLWIFFWIVKLVEYFRWEANVILMSVIWISILVWFLYTILWEDEETEWESDGIHQDNLQS